MSRAGRERGLSLIELTAAIAIFALVAVMGAQALSGMIRLREGLAARSEQAAALDRALSLLRADLSALVPMLFYPPGRAAPQSALRFQGGVLALSLGGQPGTDSPPEPGAPGLQRAEWQIENGTLTRRFWPALMPARADGRTPPMPVLEGVRGLSLRSYWEDAGWRAGTGRAGAAVAAPDSAADGDQAGPAPEVYSSTLPLAVELTLETRDFGTITLLETLK